MHCSSRSGVLAAAAVAFLASAAGAEDLTIVSSVSTGKGPAKTSTQYLSASKVRVGDGDSDSIVDVASGRFTVVDHARKQYWESSFAELDAAARAMQEQLKAAGPMAEKMMKMMGQGAAANVAVAKGTAPRKIAGYDTDHYVVTVGDNMKYEVWAAPGLTPPMEYYDAMRSRTAMMGPMAKSFEAVYAEMRKIKGFPLATATSVKMGPMNQEFHSEVTEIKKGAIPASVFELPAGYKKVDSPMAKMGAPASR